MLIYLFIPMSDLSSLKQAPVLEEFGAMVKLLLWLTACSLLHYLRLCRASIRAFLDTNACQYGMFFQPPH
jgi:hypothetical protein